MRETDEPILMLNHYWDISDKIRLNNNIAYQFGEIANSRIDNGGTRLVEINGESAYLGGARNPTPEYYQNLPSFFLNVDNPTAYDFQQAFIAQENFVNDGQFNWSNLFQANQAQTALGYNSIYVLQEDRVDDTQLSMNSILFTELNDNIKLNASIGYRSLKSENFASVKDLLDGTGFLDVDFFAETQTGQIASNLAQSDLRNPNRIAVEGDRYKYNYEIDSWKDIKTQDDFDNFKSILNSMKKCFIYSLKFLDNREIFVKIMYHLCAKYFPLFLTSLPQGVSHHSSFYLPQMLPDKKQTMTGLIEEVVK